MHFMPMRDKIGKPHTMGLSLVFSYFPCPKMLVGIDKIQNWGTLTFFVHNAQVHQVSMNGMWRWPGTHHKSNLGPLIDESLILLDSKCGISARGASPTWPLAGELHIRWFLKLGFCSVGDNAFHANEGQTWKAMDGGDAFGVAIFPMPKHTSRSLLFNMHGS